LILLPLDLEVKARRDAAAQVARAEGCFTTRPVPRPAQPARDKVLLNALRAKELI